MNNMEKKDIKSSDFGFALTTLPCNNTVPAFLTLLKWFLFSPSSKERNCLKQTWYLAWILTY